MSTKDADLFFDCVYIINLEYRRDRLKTLLKSANKAKLDQAKFQIFKAIIGKEIDQPSNWKFKPGELGCLESHLAVLKDAKAKSYKHILVLEDDITFCSQFKRKLGAVVSELPPDWDMLYLYSYHYLPPQVYSQNLNKCTSTLSTVAYAVNSKSLALLIERIQDKNYAVDVILAKQHQKINAFASKKKLCIHYDGYSDIKQKNIKYELTFYDKVYYKLISKFRKWS